MANLGSGEKIVVTVTSYLRAEKYDMYNGGCLDQSIDPVQNCNAISMVKSSRLFVATQETSGAGENLTQKSFQYWG